MFHLIAKSLRKRLVQTVGVFLSVLISAAALFALALVGAGIPQSVATVESRLGADMMLVPQGTAKYVSESNLLFSGAALNTYMSTDILDQLSGTGVRRSTAQLYCSSKKADSCCATSYVLIGIDPDTDWVVSPWLPAGSFDISQLEGDTCIIGCDVHDFDNKDTVTIMGVDLHCAATLERTNTSLDGYIIVSLDTIREQMRTSSAEHQTDWARYGDPDDLISDVLIDTGGADSDAETSIANILHYRTGADVVQVGNVISDRAAQLDSIYFFMGVAGVVLAAIALLQLFARYYAITWNRRNEWGLYLALGATHGYLRRLLAGEVVLLTGSAALVGCIAGFGLSCWISQSIATALSFDLILNDPATIALATCGIVIGFAVLGLLSSVVSMAQIARLSPSSAMQRQDIG